MLSAQIGMSNSEMANILKELAVEKEGEPGNWHCVYNSHPVFVLTDETANRMRIFAPILEESELKVGQMKAMLEANFNSALDAKYSLYEGFVISVFTHPLEELTKDQFVNAMSQVVNLSKNFGSSYTSADLKLLEKPAVEEDKTIFKKS